MLPSPPLTVHQLENSPPLPPRIPIDKKGQRRVESNRTVLSPRKLNFQTMLRKSTETNEIRMAATRVALLGSMTGSMTKLPVDSVASKTPSNNALSLKQLPKGANGVPIIVEACLRYLAKNATECVGLFLVPSSESRVQQMWDYMQDHPCARMSINCLNVFMRKHKEFTANDVANFLKLLIKSIVGNDSVITSNCYAPLVHAINSNRPSHIVREKCRRIIGQLVVPARRLLLGRLCNFLRDFCQHEAKTKMNCAKLAWCFKHLIQTPQDNTGKAPRATVPNTRSTCKSISSELFEKGEQIKLCVSVIETLIKHSQHVFLHCLSLKHRITVTESTCVMACGTSLSCVA